MSTSKEQAAVISERQRLWEVRKYCQVRPVLGRNDVNGGELSEEPQVAELSPPDAALSSLLKLLMDRLDADVAMVSLLDEETQFFLAGAGKDNSESAVKSAKWFGCNQVSHYGGLCERTIAIGSTQHPAIYEELDMSRNSRTKGLPYFNGTLAKFRYYAGAPLKTAAGNTIGTIFVISHRPSSGLDAARQQVLAGTASDVMRQLTLTLQALEGERLMQFQSATAALLQRERPSLYQQANGLPRGRPGVIQQPSHIVEVYQHAAEVMRQSLKLEVVLFQYVPSDDRTPQATPGNWQVSTLATSLNVESSRPESYCIEAIELMTCLANF
jgi:hypothetical protein